jgi:hypothetical protein
MSESNGGWVCISDDEHLAAGLFDSEEEATNFYHEHANVFRGAGATRIRFVETPESFAAYLKEDG